MDNAVCFPSFASRAALSAGGPDRKPPAYVARAEGPDHEVGPSVGPESAFHSQAPPATAQAVRGRHGDFLSPVYPGSLRATGQRWQVQIRVSKQRRLSRSLQRPSTASILACAAAHRG